jgi:hypothetical protein
LTLGRLKYLEDGTISVDGADQLLEEYLELTAKGKAAEDVVCHYLYACWSSSQRASVQIKTLKEECAISRSECDFISSKIRTPSDKLRQSLRHRAGLAEGRPESGFVDREAIADVSTLMGNLPLAVLTMLLSVSYLPKAQRLVPRA